MDKWGEEERIDRRQAKHLKKKKKYNKENKINAQGSNRVK